MCLSMLKPKKPEPIVHKEPEPLDQPDIAEGPGDAPVTGAERFRTTESSSSTDSSNARAKGTQQLRIALALPGATGVNVPS